MDLRKTLILVHDLLTQVSVDHALIGGLAMVNYGLNRATSDVDLLVDFDHRDKVKELMQQSGFLVQAETEEFLQFGGLGYVDILLARRPISRAMLKNAVLIPSLGIKCLGPEDIIGLKIQAYANDSAREYQDKADIQFLITSGAQLDWEKVKRYADLFNRWSDIEEIRSKAQLR